MPNILNPVDHPVGSRFLCDNNLTKKQEIAAWTPGLMEICEWSPSGNYVAIKLSDSYFWVRPKDIPFIEQLNSYYDEDKEYLRAFNDIRKACADRGLELDFNHNLEQILDFIRNLGNKNA